MSEKEGDAPQGASSDQVEETIRLDQFMKFGQMVESGGQAKLFIQQGEVTVNGEIETRRGRKLRHGDTVSFDGDEYDVQFGDAGEDSPELPENEESGE